MVFSLRLPLQEKCREQQMPLYIAFIDLTKAFDLVSRDGLFKVLPKTSCPPQLQSMIDSFHTDTKGAISNPQRRQLMLLPRSNARWDFLWPVAKTCIRHNNRRNLNPYLIRWQTTLQHRPSQRYNTNVHKILIRDMLFADDAAVAIHTPEELIDGLHRIGL